MSARMQRGQALLFIAVTTVIVLLVTLATYNVGQLAYHRIKLQNTADAAAYSAAVAHARELNFAAYMNRGIIANQVQVAQLVSLTGWGRNFENTYNGEFATISDVLANMSSLGAMWTVPFKGLKAGSKVVKKVVDSAFPVAVKVLDKLIAVEALAATTYHYAMLAEIPFEVIRDVVKANEDDKAVVSTLGYAAMAASAVKAKSFAKSYSPSGKTDGATRMAFVTQASTDLFYKDRTLPPIWPVPFLIDPTRLFTYGAGPLLMLQFHSGGTALKTGSSTTDNLKGFTSLDATGLFVIFCVTIPVLGIPVPIPFPFPPLPAGRGAAGAGKDTWMSSTGLQPGGGSNVDHRDILNSKTDPAAAVQYGAAHYNPMTAIPAWIQVAEGAGKNMDTSAGLVDYLDVSGNASGTTSNQAQAAGTNRNDIAPAWVLEVERPAGTIVTSNTGGYSIGGGTGQLTLGNGMNGSKMRALSRGEAYFSRPKALFPRSDGKTEWGSLYSPYWQARLAPNTLFEQAASIAGTVLFQ